HPAWLRARFDHLSHRHPVCAFQGIGIRLAGIRSQHRDRPSRHLRPDIAAPASRRSIGMIELSNLDVVFGRGTPLEKQVLNKISLTMDKGSFVTVIGSNGAGKSTMLGVLAGDVIPTAGKVVIAGQDVTRKSTADRAG